MGATPDDRKPIIASRVPEADMPSVWRPVKLDQAWIFATLVASNDLNEVGATQSLVV